MGLLGSTYSISMVSELDIRCIPLFAREIDEFEKILFA